MEQKIVTSLIICVILGIVLSIATIVIVGYEEASQAIALLKLNNWLIILSFTILHIILRFIRWQYYLIKLDHNISLIPSVIFYLSGLALTMTPGKVGETFRSVFLKPHGVSYTNSISAFFVERYTDLLAVIALSTLVLAYFSKHQSPVFVVCVFVLAILLIVRGPWLIRLLNWVQLKISNERIRSTLLKLSNLLKASSTLLSPIPLISGFIIALVAWSIQGYTFYLILSYINVSVSLDFAVGCYALAILAGAVSFLPGGLGSTEAVMILLLFSIGISTIDATAATLITRVATLWFAVAIGLCALIYAEMYRRTRKLGSKY